MCFSGLLEHALRTPGSERIANGFQVPLFAFEGGRTAHGMRRYPMALAINALAHAELIDVMQEVRGGLGGIRTEEIPMEAEQRHLKQAANLRTVDALVLFIIATVASFIGSLQAGLVNTAVLAHTVQRGAEAGRRMAIGGALPELIYAAIAFQFATMLLHWLGLSTAGIGLLVGAILVAIGLYFLLLFKPRFEVDEAQLKASGVRKGLLIGLLNPQLLLFWCGVKLSLSSFGVDGEGLLDLVAFALGAFVGALILLMQLVRLGRRALERLKPRTLRWMFRVVGILLVLSGLYGIARTRAASGPQASALGALVQSVFRSNSR